MFKTRNPASEKIEPTSVLRSRLDDHYLLLEGYSLIIIVGTLQCRAIFIESYKEGDLTIKAIKFNGDLRRPSLFSDSIADAQTSYWKTIDFIDNESAIKDFKKLRTNQICYCPMPFNSSYTSEINTFIATLNGHHGLLSEVDEMITSAYQKAFNAPLRYNITSSSSCSVM